ncbi:MAG: 3-phosphoshikimate 1-carboxyvinyltransferase [Chloroflexota bacterium]|nr:3-phosphoshikimate 1-carboxyvinyltransferase [Chloroflexota bacterium]
MSQIKVSSGKTMCGRVRVPSDKSISHRALLLGALADGASQISGFLPAGDCLATLACLRALGVEVDCSNPTEICDGATLTIHGRGLRGLCAPAGPLNCVRSGTTMRLLAGILAGQPFESVLVGAPQLLRRPMRRIVEPLRRMGGEVEEIDGHAPLTLCGRRLHGYDHTLTIASAQVKSALLLAGLYADGPTTVRQPGPARDHTELMLAAMGAVIEVDGLTVSLAPGPSPLAPLHLAIPGDISSAAFPLVAAALTPGSEVTIEDVGINPTRTGLLDVLRAMGAKIELKNEREQGNEPVADVTVRASELVGVEIGGDTVVRMIDEFPVLAVAATQARGVTRVRDAAELRVKETDRIALLVAELRALGARIDALPDGFTIEGPTPLRGAVVDSHGDHRLAMALAVAGLIAEEEVVIENAECIGDSFPGFVELMRRMGAAYD